MIQPATSNSIQFINEMIFGPYSPGRFGGLTFGIDNNVSMKVRNKKDTGQNAIKKDFNY